MAHNVHISATQKRDAYAKVNGICFICGQKLSNNEREWSVDHFIPRAVYKWVPNQELQSLIESENNIFVVHPKCNYSKDSELPTNKKINSMHAQEVVKNGIKELYKVSAPSIAEYNAIKQRAWDIQGQKCAFCGKKIPLNAATLRRRDNNKHRGRDNAMCLCDKCNVLAGNAHYKKKMVAKKDIL